MELKEQKRLLNYLLTCSSDKLFTAISSNAFDDTFYALTLGMSQQFYETYKSKPKLVSWEKWLNTVKTIPNEIKEQLTVIFKECNGEFQENTAFYEKAVIEQIKLQYVNSMQLDIAENENDPVYAKNRVIKLISDIDSLVLTDSTESYNLTDPNFTDIENLIVTPSPFNNLNRLTEDGGFATPSIIVIAAPPKTNKTTFLVNLGYGYACQGKHVLFVDFENGKRNIKKRFRQRAALCSSKDFAIGSVLPEIGMTAVQSFTASIDKIKRTGGDVHFFSVPVNSIGLSAIDAEILRLKSIGIEITCIIYDSVEQSICEDKSIREDTKQIQWKYLEAIKLNQKHNLFSFTPSHINREGIKALKVGVKGGEYLAGDIGKLQNAHAVFLLEYKEVILTQDDDTVVKILNLHVLAQREGVREGTIHFILDMAYQLVEEFEMPKPADE